LTDGSFVKTGAGESPNFQAYSYGEVPFSWRIVNWSGTPVSVVSRTTLRFAELGSESTVIFRSAVTVVFNESLTVRRTGKTPGAKNVKLALAFVEAELSGDVPFADQLYE
jgi:hypothetical protein